MFADSYRSPENINLEQQNEELQLVLDSLELEKSNLARDKSDVSRLLQETQARLRDSESVKTEQTRRIKELERESQSAKNIPVGTVGIKPIEKKKRIKVCDKFSDDNENVNIFCRGVSGNKGWSVNFNRDACQGPIRGYCFLNHLKIRKNEILKWGFRVPNHKFKNITTGMVIILE